jgi:hypothetical protein
MKEGLSAVAVLVSLVIVAVLIAAAVFGIRWAIAGPSGKLNAREQIQSGDNRIAQYDKFFALCASVQTDEQAVEASKEQLRETDKHSGQRSVIQTNITAQKIARQDAVNTYNQDAAATYTQGQFLASNLPFRLPVEIPEGGTQCAA